MESDARNMGNLGLNMRRTSRDASMLEDNDEKYYDLNSSNRRGHCIIFNQKNFDNPRLSTRDGTDKDRDDCEKLFKSLRMKVEVKNDYTVAEIKEEIEDVADEDHSKTDCLVVCFFSHGEQDMLYGRDKSFPADEITMKFKSDSCPGLAGKPKLFFIQACRGDEKDVGVLLQKDSDSLSYRIPTTSDFLVCWATVPGYISWRDTTNGSWFIQSLMHIMNRQKYEDDLVSLMTTVNRYMIKKFEANNEEKQCATIVSTLQRKVKFNELQY